MTSQLQAYRSKQPIRRTGCLIAQLAVPMPGLDAGVRLRDWAAELIALDNAIDEAQGLRVVDVKAADLDALECLIELDAAAEQGGGTSAADPLQPERDFLDAARRALAGGDRVFCVEIE